jgi:hypothetical protein
VIFIMSLAVTQSPDFLPDQTSIDENLTADSTQTVRNSAQTKTHDDKPAAGEANNTASAWDAGTPTHSNKRTGSSNAQLQSVEVDGDHSEGDIKVSDLGSAKVASEKMSQSSTTTTTTSARYSAASTALNPRFELTYLNCCTAASVGLFVLSVLSFVLPSVSTYPDERPTVQGLGYTAGVIALFASLATGACVVSVHSRSGDFRR